MRYRMILLILFFIIMPFLVLAAGPGSTSDHSDLYTTSNLDSWVYMLVLAPVAGTLTAVFLRGQALKKSEKDKQNNLASITKEPIDHQTSVDKHSEAA
jgi:hypothetical protein